MGLCAVFVGILNCGSVIDFTFYSRHSWLLVSAECEDISGALWSSWQVQSLICFVFHTIVWWFLPLTKCFFLNWSSLPLNRFQIMKTAFVPPVWTDDFKMRIHQTRARSWTRTDGVCAVYTKNTRGQCPKIKCSVCMSPFIIIQCISFMNHSFDYSVIKDVYIELHVCAVLTCWAESADRAEWPQQETKQKWINFVGVICQTRL